jgi:hypothetical protein
MADDTTSEEEALQKLLRDRRENTDYKAFRGKLMQRQRFLELVPVKSPELTYDRYLPFADIRLMDPEKPESGAREIVLEYSGMTVVITGRNLRGAAVAMANDLIGTVEAHDPELHGRPPPRDDPSPFVESIRFYRPRRGLEARVEALEKRLGELIASLAVTPPQTG